MTKYLTSLAGLFLIAGCAHKPSLVGKWQGNQSAQGVLTIEFKSDGTQINTIASPLGQVVTTGNYQADGTHLTETAASLTLNGAPFPLSANPHPVTGHGTYTLDGDTLTITDNNPPAPAKTYSLHRLP